MRLAELTGPRRFVLRDVPLPEPGPDEVLVRVAACGVCASELSQWTRPPNDGPAASDPPFLISDHLDRYGIDYAVLTGPFVLPLGSDPAT